MGTRIADVFSLYTESFGWMNGVSNFIKVASMKYGFKVDSLKVKGIKHPIFLRSGSSDIPTFNQIFVHREYDIDIKDAPKVIIDGGSNIGLFSILMKNNFPDSKIICIEPDKENFHQACKNLSKYSNISMFNFGIWNKDIGLKVFDKHGLGKWGMVVEETENPAEANVKAITIDTIMKNFNLNRIDILKLDIETSEKALFEKNFEVWLPKVKMLIVELHDNMLPGCSQAFYDAINKTFKKYTASQSGENVIIVNEDLT